MPGLLDVVMNAWRNSRFGALAPPLAVDAWVPGRGVRIGVPWPWSDAGPFEAPSGLEPILRVEAPRTDVPVSLELWREPMPRPLDSALPTLVQDLSQLHRGQVVDVRKLRLHGSRAVVAAVDVNGAHRCWRIITERGGHLVQGQMDVPLGAADGYAPHLDTMLGTWTWEG